MNPVLAIIGGSLLAVALGHMVLAFLAFARVAKRNKARELTGCVAVTCAIYCACMGLTYLSAYFHRDYEITYRLAWVGYLAIPFMNALANFHYEKPGRWRVLLVKLNAIFWPLMLVLNVATNLIDRAPTSLIPYVKIEAPLDTCIRLIASLNLIWIIIDFALARRLATSIRRHRSGILILGIMIYATGGLLFAGGLQNLTGFAFDPGLVGYFSFPWLILTYYAVTRYRLFNIQLALSRVLSMLVVSAVVALIAAVFDEYLHRFIGGWGPVAIAAFCATTLVTAVQLSRFTSNFFQVLLVKRIYDYQDVLQKMSSLSVSLYNTDEILKRFIKLTHQNLQLSSARFFVQVKSGFSLYASEGTAEISDMDPKALAEWFSKIKKTFIKEEQELESDAPEIQTICRFLTSIGGEIAAPAFYQDNLLGFMILGSKLNKDSFTDEDIRLIETVLNQTALSIENARLFDEATTDGLTGLYHQKYFKTRLKNEFQRASRHEISLGLLFVDIDHFKKINDTHGHLCGDQILKDVSKILQQSFRAEDIVARYGGEEFAILLLEPKQEYLWLVAERLRLKVAQHSYVNGVPVTVSIGICLYEPGTTHATELEILDRADQALYAAKNSGRNRSVSWNDELNLKSQLKKSAAR